MQCTIRFKESTVLGCFMLYFHVNKPEGVETIFSLTKILTWCSVINRFFAFLSIYCLVLVALLNGKLKEKHIGLSNEVKPDKKKKITGNKC